MLIKCIHGYFKIEESQAGEISRFMNLFPVTIVARGDHFTFKTLSTAPKHSIAGNRYLNALCTKTAEGEPWFVMRENGLVYDFEKDLVVPIQTITSRAVLVPGSNYFLSTGLILPGSITEDGTRVTDYSAWYLFDSGKFNYTEVISG